MAQQDAATDGECSLSNSTPDRVVEAKKVWTTLITNTSYLPGLLTLHYSLIRVGTRYPLIALYTDTFPAEGHAALDARSIPKKRVRYLIPTNKKDYSNDPRFYDCWSKLTPFGLTEFERVVQLDSDMLVLRNMDELMDLKLDPPSTEGSDGGNGKRVFAASHACVCNPLKKPHYPKDWISPNCAFTSQHGTPDIAQKEGAPSAAGLAMPNGGLQVVNPSADHYKTILAYLESDIVLNYDFADQSLLGDLFHGRWVSLPYTYNALKTMRWKDVHAPIWRDEEVKNVHYILGPKPWEEKLEEVKDESHRWWHRVHTERKEAEKRDGICDDF